MYTIDDFLSLIREMIQFFEELINSEQLKLEAVLANNVPKMEECMKKEQVSILKLRGYDKKREQMQEMLSFGKLTFREIIPLVPEVNKDEMAELFSMLNLKTKEYNSISGSLKTAMEVNIHKIDKRLSELKNTKIAKEGHIYSNNGLTDNKQTHTLTNRRI